MSRVDLILFDEEYKQILEAITRLRTESNALSVFMIEKSGQTMASTGNVSEIDVTALASLAAGNVAATEGLAGLIGESEFSTLFHEGAHQNILMTLIEGRVILVVVFNESSSLGLVRLRVRRAGIELAGILEAVQSKAASGVSPGGQDAPFAGISDEDIDSLFAD